MRNDRHGLLRLAEARDVELEHVLDEGEAGVVRPKVRHRLGGRLRDAERVEACRGETRPRDDTVSCAMQCAEIGRDMHAAACGRVEGWGVAPRGSVARERAPLPPPFRARVPRPQPSRMGIDRHTLSYEETHLSSKKEDEHGRTQRVARAMVTANQVDEV